MLSAVYGGLSRLGLPLPQLAALEDVHGPLMICGVFGTLISLERAVAIGTGWPYAAPACFALCAANLVLGWPTLAALLAVSGAIVFSFASAWIARRQVALFTTLLLLGALMLLAGAAFWLGGAPVPDIVAWWLGFLVCTIAAERLELARVARPSTLAKIGLVAAIVAMTAGAALGLPETLGRELFGAGVLAIALWLALNDVARSTIRMQGQSRFMAAAMLAGYVWLAIAGVVLLAHSSLALSYDLVLHAIGIGFVLSMVFAHALLIFPAVAGITLRYIPALYLSLGLLHASVVLRVIGDWAELHEVRLLSGPVTLLALVTFAGLLAFGRRQRLPAARQ